MLPFQPPAAAGEAIVQIAYVVEDIDAAVAHWAAAGAGPFFTSAVAVPDGLYRGRRSPLRYEASFGFHDAMNIELIRQTDTAPSVYREMLDERGPGFHHFMVRTTDYHATLARYAGAGIAPAYEAELPGSGPWAYLDARRQLGCYVEIYEMQETVADMWRRMAAAHREWDGTRPNRRHDEL